MAFKQSSNLAQFSVEDLAEYLLDHGIRTGLVVDFRRNVVNGAAFLQLTEEDLKELVPLLGERVLIRQLLKQSKLVCSMAYCNTKQQHIVMMCGCGCISSICWDISTQECAKASSPDVSIRAVVSSHPCTPVPSQVYTVFHSAGDCVCTIYNIHKSK